MAAAEVLWVSPSFGYGGDLMYFEALFRACAAAMPGTVVAVAADHPALGRPGLPLAPLLPAERAGDVAGPGAAYGGERRRRPSWRTARMLLGIDAACFVTIEFTPLAALCLVVAALRRRPSVLLIENHPRYRGGAVGPRARLVKGGLARLATVVLTSNEESAAWVRDDLGVPRDRVLVGAYLTAEPDGPGRDDPRPDREDRARRILFVNSVTRRKGLAELLGAFAVTAAARSGDAVLDVVGDGDDLERCRSIADGSGLADAVRFHGRSPYSALGPWFAGADLVVNPSLSDYRSLVGFEALLFRRPVLLSSRDGAAGELARFTEVVTVADPADGDALATALDRALEARTPGPADPVWAAIRTEYSPEAVARRIRDATTAARRRRTRRR